MKGIIRMLEAIIASIIMLASLTFFFVPQPRPVVDDTLLISQSADVLASLEKSGNIEKYMIMNNKVDLNKDIKAMLPSAADFSVSIIGLPSPDIFVGCGACSSTDRIELEGIIEGSYKYKSRNMQIRVDSVGINSIPPEVTVLYLMGYQDLTPYESSINNFLSRGGGLVMVSDLTQAQVQDNFMDSVFGLSWLPGTPGTSNSFYNKTNASEPSFRVFKYYNNVTNNVESNRELFDNFHGNNIAAGFGTVINDGQFAAAKANRLEEGRTLWLADYDATSENAMNRTANLLRASVMWASGDRYSMDEIGKTPGQVHSAVSYIVAGYTAGSDNIFEPFIVQLTVWKIFL